MISKAQCEIQANKFRKEHGLDEGSNENIVAAIHLMNTHRIDKTGAMDRSSRSGNDHGIDAWYFAESTRELYIYQSKLTDVKQYALGGLQDLVRALEWLEQVIIAEEIEAVPSDNPCLFNLYTLVARKQANIKKVNFVLVSLYEGAELENTQAFRECETTIAKSDLNKYMARKTSGGLWLSACLYNLDQVLPVEFQQYIVDKIPETTIDLRKNSRLELAYVSLSSLVELYRQRGTVLFDKNVRLSLMDVKKARERLAVPMKNTLDLITSAQKSPGIFTFYHIGVTIAASSVANSEPTLLSLENPSILNGCQTITIAHEHLKQLEEKGDSEAIKRFNQIKVIAKVVIGTTDDELKEITNSNNRQNPIENWQLFSNEPVHIEIESALREIEVFYERQEGKFKSEMKRKEKAKHYEATNGTYIKVVDLGQIIALCRHNLSWAAKPSEIFLNKVNHDEIFDISIPQYARDMVFVSNLLKAVKRALANYLQRPAHVNSSASYIFDRPILKMHVYYVAVLYYYQNESKSQIRAGYAQKLNKIANAKIVDDLESFYMRIVTKIKNWYTEESKELTTEVSKRKMDSFFADLATDLGIDTAEGAVPFTPTTADWEKILS